MAKKQNTPQRNPGQPQPRPANNIPQQQKQPARPAKAEPAGESFIQKNAQWLMMGVVAVVTYIFYAGSLGNKFTNWDDLGYVLTNPLIKDNSAEGIKRIFSTNHPVMGNYHPLTIVTYVFEYAKDGLEPWVYHFDNLIFHILTTLAVFGFVKVLTRRNVAAFIAALLFGLHPMHVESVAWVAGRKDLMYGFFYVLACSAYVYYVRNKGGKKWIWYGCTVVLFALSLLCKSVGVTLPIVLFLIDYFEGREFTEPDIYLDKLPHFGLSVLFGLLSIQAQKNIGALGTLDVHFTTIERLAIGCYSLITYFWKMFLPVGLTNFYPYPIKVGGSLPGVFYIYPVILIGLLVALWLFARKNRLVVFGIAFFIINLLLLLQIIPVGGAIMSDRYTYIPYLGLFLIVGWVVSQYYDVKEKKPMGNVVMGGALVCCFIFGYMTYERTKDWYDSVSLWKDAIDKHPESPIAYFYLGQEYYTRFESAVNATDRKNYGDSAYAFFRQSVARKPDYASPIICIGEYQRSTGQYDSAKVNYLKALSISDKNESAYLGLGVVYAIKQQFDSAGIAFRKALSLKEYFPEGHSNYANYLEITGKTDSALAEYAFSIHQNPDAYIPYMNRARIYIKLNKFDEAIKDYDRASLIKPENPDPYYMRSQALARQGKKAQALQDADKAKALGGQVDAAYYQSLKS